MFLGVLLFLLQIKYFTSVETTLMKNIKNLLFCQNQTLSFACIHVGTNFCPLRKTVSQTEPYFCSLVLHLAVYGDHRFFYVPHTDLNWGFFTTSYIKILHANTANLCWENSPTMKFQCSFPALSLFNSTPGSCNI